MKSSIILISFLLYNISSVLAQEPFITTWKTDIPGTLCNSCITIPTIGIGYNYDVDWDNDGTYDEQGLTTSVTHDFGSPGTYTIRIKGTFPRIRFDYNDDNRHKILNIGQWGDIAWASMERAFRGCSNLNSDATDTIDLSNVTSMNLMFNEASSFNADIGHWDVSNVTDMGGIFFRASAFNKNLNDWNIENVVNTSFSFYEATSYNQPMDKWTLSSATNLNDMFGGATSFNQDISGWNTQNMVFLRGMFQNATSFNQDISGWNMSSAENMFFMFASSGLDQDLSNWNIEKVTDLFGMFNASAMSVENLDQTIIGWSQQNVQPNLTIGVRNLFYCTSESQRQSLIDTHYWTFDGDTKACEPFIATFKTDHPGASCDKCITIPTSASLAIMDIDWESDGTYDDFMVTSSITHEYPVAGTYQVTIRGDLHNLNPILFDEEEKILSIDQWGGTIWSNFTFSGCSNLTIPASDAPDLSNVSNFNYLFRGATSLNNDISHWNVAGVQSMEAMFSDATSFDQDLSNWNISSVDVMSNMFNNSGLSIANYDKTLNSWFSQGLAMNVNMGSGLQYCNSQEAHDELTANYNWTFFDQLGRSTIDYTNPSGGNWHDKPSWSVLEVPATCNDILLDKGGAVDIQAGEEGVGATLQVDIGTALTVQAGGTLEILELP